MSRTHKPRDQVFAIIRFDLYQDALENKVTVTKVLTTVEAAEAEVQRLNDLNADKECRYIWQSTRLFRDGTQQEE